MTNQRTVTANAAEQNIAFSREFDARTSGSCSYVIAGGGGEWDFHGLFHEVTAPAALFAARADG